jgi:hypothetical protein
VETRANEEAGERGLVTFAVRNSGRSDAVWTALGMNDDIGMYGADFNVFVPGSSESTFRDMYNHEKPYATPLDDEYFSITPIKAYKSSTSVEFMYSRPLVTCPSSSGLVIDVASKRRRRNLLATVMNVAEDLGGVDAFRGDIQDFSIRNAQGMYLLWAFGTSSTFSQHSSSNRGAVFVHIVDQPDISTVDESTYFDIRPRAALTIPEAGTVYACTKHDLGTTERWFNAYEIINDIPGHLHHMNIHFCTDGSNSQNDPFVASTDASTRAVKDQGFYDSGTNSHTGDETITGTDYLHCDSIHVTCSEPIAMWAVGGVRITFPEGTARKVGGSGANAIRYVMIQRHVDAIGPGGLEDRSGIRFFETSSQSKEVGSFITGIVVDDSVTIARSGVYSHTAICPGACTEARFTEDMHVFAIFGHQHTTGTANFVHHIRDGVELEPLLENPFFDFDLQIAVRPNGFERIIRPGDDIFTECIYDTTNRNSQTNMGYGTTDEMCLTYILYYPRMDTFGCIDAQQLGLSVTSCPPASLTYIGGWNFDASAVNNEITLTQVYSPPNADTCAATYNEASGSASSILTAGIVLIASTACVWFLL